ncbi:hypothetical protein [Leptospira noguchii]|uniref:hypothetical protein n=1 Tax=Leptospira noguchii TaxID=28182 RepID=UPI001FB7B09B|nr:hypothetical protein [Leptospira noguchii]UOG48316.1 hypothetical protein MAL00_15095 [Leptospira noguchii]
METQQNAHMDRVGNSTQRFPKGRVVDGNSVLQRICRNSHRFNIEIQILVGLVMAFLRIAF